MYVSGKVLIISLLTAGTYSCTPQFGAPLMSNDLAYMAKPAATDSSHWGTYVSFNGGNSSGYLEDDGNTFWEINCHQSYTFETVSVALGTFGYSGKFSVHEGNLQNYPRLQPLIGDYFYYGGGIRGSFNVTIPSYWVDFRFIGLDFAWSREYGEYLGFRREVHRLSQVEAVTKDVLVSVAITSEVLIKFNPKSRLGIMHMLGNTTIGKLKSEEEGLFDSMMLGISYTYKPIFAFTQISFADNSGVRFGVGYQLF